MPKSILEQIAKEINKEIKKELEPKPQPKPKPPVAPPPSAKITLPAYKKAIFLASVEGDEFPKDNYPSSMEKLIGEDLRQLHRQLIDEELLAKPTISQILASYKNSDLKEMLAAKGIKGSNNKEEMIQSLVESLSADEMLHLSKGNHTLALSPKGMKYIDKYGDYVYLYKKESRYKTDVDEYAMYVKSYPDKGTYEILKQINKDHMKDVKGDLSKMALNEAAKANIYEDEMKETGKNKTKEIVNANMKYIYYSLNDSSELEKAIRGMEKGEKIQPPAMEDFFTNTLLKTIDTYREEIGNYDFNNLPEENTLPYCICPKHMLFEILKDYLHNPKPNIMQYNKMINDSKMRTLQMMSAPHPKGPRK